MIEKSYTVLSFRALSFSCFAHGSLWRIFWLWQCLGSRAISLGWTVSTFIFHFCLTWSWRRLDYDLESQILRLRIRTRSYDWSSRGRVRCCHDHAVPLRNESSHLFTCATRASATKWNIFALEKLRRACGCRYLRNLWSLLWRWRQKTRRYRRQRFGSTVGLSAKLLGSLSSLEDLLANSGSIIIILLSVIIGFQFIFQFWLTAIAIFCGEMSGIAVGTPQRPVHPVLRTNSISSSVDPMVKDRRRKFDRSSATVAEPSSSSLDDGLAAPHGFPTRSSGLVGLQSVSPLQRFGIAKDRVSSLFTNVSSMLDESVDRLLVHAEDNVLNTNESLKQIVQQAKNVIDADQARMANISEKVRHNSMKVAFFGRTSNGKSSVINAMLRDRILPSGIGHTTSCFLCVQGTPESSAYLITPESSDRRNVQVSTVHKNVAE